MTVKPSSPRSARLSQILFMGLLSSKTFTEICAVGNGSGLTITFTFVCPGATGAPLKV
jgi:hypothetical protein